MGIHSGSQRVSDRARRRGAMTPMKEQSNVVEELERLFERMSRQFDDASYRWESQGPLMAWPSGTDEMSIDLVDRDDELVVTVDLPGFERDDIDTSHGSHAADRGRTRGGPRRRVGPVLTARTPPGVGSAVHTASGRGRQGRVRGA